MLDHELHHLEVKRDKRGVVRDDLGRPAIVLRPHDVEIGWFHVVAVRNGIASQERIQAKKIFDEHGQYYWPEIAAKTDMQVEMSVGGQKVFAGTDRDFKKMAREIGKKK